MERIRSGIPGLDKLIEGGFVKGHQILLAGETGTGKTIFACQFLLEGARNGENGFYIIVILSISALIFDPTPHVTMLPPPHENSIHS